MAKHSLVEGYAESYTIAMIPLFCLVMASFLEGKVADALTGEPLNNARLELSTGEATTTDREGRFRLDNKPGSTLRVTLVGYRPERIVLSEAETLDVRLTPDNLNRRENLTVSAGPFEASLTGSELKNLSSVLADDPLRAVQSLPGVAANNDFSSQFSLRGAPFAQIGIYIDGILLRNPFHAVQNEPSSGSLTIFNGDLIEALTLHSSAPPVALSDRTAGALAVQLREGSRLRPAVRLTAGAAGAGALAEGPLNRSKTASWLVGVRKSYLQYILSRASNDPTLAFDFFDTQGKLAWSPTPKQTLSLGFFDGVSGLDRTSTTARLGTNSILESAYRSTLINLGWQYRANTSFLTTQRVAFLRERAENRNPQRLPLARTYGGEWVWRGDATYKTLQFGGSVRRLRDEGAVTRYQANPFAVRPLDAFRGTGLRSGAYVEQSGEFRKVRLTAGARFDHLVGSAVSPYAALAWQIRPATKLSATLSQAAQFPNFLQGIQLLPTRSNHFVAAMEQLFGERTRLRVEVYQRWDRDLIFRPLEEPRLLATGQIFHPPVLPPFRNSQRAHSRGVEFTLQRRSANRLNGWVSYSFGRATVRDGVLGIVFPADFDQRHTVNVYGSYRLRPSLNLSSHYSYGSNFPVAGFFRQQSPTTYFLTAQRNGFRLPEYHRADVRINKSFTWQKWRGTLFLEVQNFTNENNRRLDSYNGYNTRTGQAFLTFNRLFPILPAAGVMFEWER